ncbi:hypothetical protein AB0O42_09605 [Streptomyces sp. NPDC089922]|uniref:Imm32 family immunity protein n=1 Tax=Streptomyces sp. NPDC089922 TaxID=3155189 RepID=UPI0034167E3E
MLQVLCSEDDGELELSGTRQRLLVLTQLLSGNAGGCSLSEAPDPFPYERSLSDIVVHEDPERDTASIIVEEQILRIWGGREALDLLARNIAGFASEADANHHLHLDYPACDYIAEESVPLVVAFTK